MNAIHGNSRCSSGKSFSHSTGSRNRDLQNVFFKQIFSQHARFYHFKEILGVKSWGETQICMKFLCFADIMFCSTLKRHFRLSGISLTKQVSHSDFSSDADLSGLFSLPLLWERTCHFSFSLQKSSSLWHLQTWSHKMLFKDQRGKSPCLCSICVRLCREQKHTMRLGHSYMGDPYSLSHVMAAKPCHHTSCQQCSWVLPALERS